MREPSLDALAPDLARAARALAERLSASKHEAWLVGGAVRDLALERPVTDLDFTTDATPAEVEAIFERTHAVGRAFGTVVVPFAGRVFEVTTFRTEEGYQDARRPDVVRFGRSVEEDARRRDFTCNALYLDPRTGRLEDPTGGWADLAASRLRCVGEPEQRFREDGLRLVRLARFAAVLGFVVDPPTWEAARRAHESLRGVSPERVRAELERIFRAGAGAAALERLWELGAVAWFLPGLSERGYRESHLARLAAVDSAGDPVLALAALLDPGPDPVQTDRAAPLSVLDGLRPSRRDRAAVLGTWEAADLAGRLAAQEDRRPAQLAALARLPGRARGLQLAGARGVPAAALAALESGIAALGPAGAAPEPLADAALLSELGVPRGPAFGRLLAAALDAQIDGELATRDDARRFVERWLAQDGGNQPRNA